MNVNSTPDGQSPPDKQITPVSAPVDWGQVRRKINAGGGGKGESFTYNGNSWKTSIAHTFTESGTNNGGLTFNYTFDASGLPLTKSFSRDSNRNETYTYDAADRLASNTRGIPGSQSWSLDKLGNWNSVTTDSVTQNRDHSVLTPGPQNGLNEIIALKDASNNVTDNLSYDDAGNLTAITPVSGTSRSFTWDANSRLKTWVKGGTTIDYHYDAYGRRVSDGERRYIYCHGWRVCEERDLSNPKTDITDGSLVAMPLMKTLVYGNYLDEVVQYDTKVNPSYNTAPGSNWDGRGDSGYDASWTDGKTGEQVYSRTYHIHCDQIYSAKALTNSAGDLAEYYDYTAYGTPTVYKGAGTDTNWFTSDDVVSTDGAGNPKSNFKNDHLYTEQRWDIGTQQQYYKQRYFDSQLGRFIGRWSQLNLDKNQYNYQFGLPISLPDPFGDPDLPPIANQSTKVTIDGKVWQSNGEGTFRIVSQSSGWRLDSYNPSSNIYGALRPQDWNTARNASTGSPNPGFTFGASSTWQKKFRDALHSEGYAVDEEDQFQMWFDSEDLRWLAGLPDCPCCEPTTLTTLWEKSDMFISTYHPGAAHSYRSLTKVKGSGQQCNYDAAGLLITHGPAAGTADRVGPGGALVYSPGHVSEDVKPFDLALKLDSGNYNGQHVQKYIQMRPINQGKTATGAPCPKNP